MAITGRPTKYSKQILIDTKKYLALCVDKDVRQVASTGKNSVMYTHKRVVKLPTYGGLAKYLKLNRDTIFEWVKIHPEFSDLIGDLMAEQEDRLINGGINGDYNPTISKVLLTKHGYREGHELANPDGSNVFRPNGKDKEAADEALQAL